MRHPYKMRRVVRTFRRRPRWAERQIAHDVKMERASEPYAVNALEIALELECGHTKRDPWECYSNEKAVKLRAILHRLFTPNEKRMVRCYECPDSRPASPTDPSTKEVQQSAIVK